MQVTSLYATEVVLYCPHCHHEESGFCGNPQGIEFTCCSCKKNYTVHPEADIEFK